MSNQMVFKRYELKYKLTMAQYKALQETMQAHMQMDDYGKHTIHNVYFDTPDYLLIRRSIEKPCYKEKLRVRSYGTQGEAANAFIELKKKYRGVVYKRRLSAPIKEGMAFLTQGEPLQEDSQIAHEIAYFVQMYPGLAPAVNLSYEREAYFGKEAPDFRMTFDQNVRVTSYFCPEMSEQSVLSDGVVLLEVKTAQGLPAWLLAFFSEQQIYKTSFSKYGTAYTDFLLPQWRRSLYHAV